jgi:hypothetical protein
MKVLQAQFPDYILEHQGVEFTVKGKFTSDGRLYFDPYVGWNNLSALTNQDTESLNDAIDDCIYNATPDVYEYFEVTDHD